MFDLSILTDPRKFASALAVIAESTASFIDHIAERRAEWAWLAIATELDYFAARLRDKATGSTSRDHTAPTIVGLMN